MFISSLRLFLSSSSSTFCFRRLLNAREAKKSYQPQRYIQIDTYQLVAAMQRKGREGGTDTVEMEAALENAIP